MYKLDTRSSSSFNTLEAATVGSLTMFYLGPVLALPEHAHPALHHGSAHQQDGLPGSPKLLSTAQWWTGREKERKLDSTFLLVSPHAISSPAWGPPPTWPTSRSQPAPCLCCPALVSSSQKSSSMGTSQDWVHDDDNLIPAFQGALHPLTLSGESQVC